MILYKLDSFEFIPIAIIEGWNSLVWTERYVEPGEFELKTYYIDAARELIPEGTLVTLHESREVMQVESHSISTDDNGIKELTIKGRSLDLYFEWREITPHFHGKKFKMARQYTLDRVACVLMWNAVRNGTGRDALRNRVFSHATANRIPSTEVANSTTKSTPNGRRWLEGGQYHDQIYKFIKRKNAKFGIRCIRPQAVPYAFGGNIVSVTTANDNKGVYSEDDSYWMVGSIVFDLFEGVNRTVDQTTNEPVIFHYQADHLKNPNYLFSIEKFATAIWVVSSEGGVNVFAPEGSGNGLDFRVMQVDGGSPGDDESKAEFLADLPDIGEGALTEYGWTTIIDTEISPMSEYTYSSDDTGISEWTDKVEYYLGDLVTVIGEYGLKQTMRVAEYTRTEDATGERGFPGLVIEP